MTTSYEHDPYDLEHSRILLCHPATRSNCKVRSSRYRKLGLGLRQRQWRAAPHSALRDPWRNLCARFSTEDPRASPLFLRRAPAMPYLLLSRSLLPGRPSFFVLDIAQGRSDPCVLSMVLRPLRGVQEACVRKRARTSGWHGWSSRTSAAGGNDLTQWSQVQFLPLSFVYMQ